MHKIPTTEAVKKCIEIIYINLKLFLKVACSILNFQLDKKYIETEEVKV